MSSPQKNGKDFDTHVNNILKKTNETIVLDGVFRKLPQPSVSPPEIMRKLPISGEIEISRKYGNEFRAIDSMIITNFNYIVFLQYKLHKTKISPVM
jgi:hypothetical protein